MGNFTSCSCLNTSDEEPSASPPVINEINYDLFVDDLNAILSGGTPIPDTVTDDIMEKWMIIMETFTQYCVSGKDINDFFTIEQFMSLFRYYICSKKACKRTHTYFQFEFHRLVLGIIIIMEFDVKRKKWILTNDKVENWLTEWKSRINEETKNLTDETFVENQKRLGKDLEELVKECKKKFPNIEKIPRYEINYDFSVDDPIAIQSGGTPIPYIVSDGIMFIC